MAKARTRRTMSHRRTRVKGDWVYRANVRTIPGITGTTDDTLGTYGVGIRTQSSGINNATVIWLYDSHDRMQYTASSTASAQLGRMSPAARAEGKKAVIRRTEGYFEIEPSSWALGNICRWGWRLGAFEQDPFTGLTSVNVGYGMWGRNPPSTADYWADVKNWVKEGRLNKAFNNEMASPSWVIPIHWHGKWTLRANEGWGFWIEGEVTNIRYDTWFRSFVSDEG